MDGGGQREDAASQREPWKGRGGLSGSTLKIIAVATMLIDHTAAVVFARQIIAANRGYAIISAESRAFGWMTDRTLLYAVYRSMRLIGRLGFPLFCFLLVEGFGRTKNVKKYALRLGIFALLSEIPFDLAFKGMFYNPGYQNVYFTLFLGLVCLWGFDFFARLWKEKAGKKWAQVLGMLMIGTGVLSPAGYLFLFVAMPAQFRNTEPWILFVSLCMITAVVLGAYGRQKGLERMQTMGADITVLAVMMGLAEILHTDYSGMGVLTIAVIYALRRQKVVSMAGAGTVLTIMNSTEITAFLTMLPVALYNGKRGLRLKYFFYAFYPVHLLLLYLISVWMGLGEIIML